MIKTLKFLSQLRAKGIEVWLDGERLRCKAPSGALTPEIRQQLSEKKPDIIKFLTDTRKQRQESTPVEVKPPAVQETSTLGSLRQESISSAQQRMWILEQLRPDNSVSHHFFSFSNQGPLSIKALIGAFQAVINRHEALRTGFDKVDGKPVQIIHPKAAMQLNLVDMSNFEKNSFRPLLNKLAEQESRRHFDIQMPPLIRIVLIRFSPTDHKVMVTVHRLISDSPSVEQILDEACHSYNAVHSGSTQELPPPGGQFSEFVANQNLWMQQEGFQHDLEWWKNQLQGSTQALDLPCDHNRPAILTFPGAMHHFSIGGSIYEAITEFCSQRDCSQEVFLLMVYKILLFRLCHQADILVGCNLVDGRTTQQSKTVGHLCNWQILRTHFSSMDGSFPSIAELLEDIKTHVTEARHHGKVPYELILESLLLERDLSRNSLFQVTFSFNQITRAKLTLAGCSGASVDLGGIVSEFDLSLVFRERKECFQGTFIYNTNLFEEETIERFAGHYWSLLTSVLSEPHRNIIDHDPLSQEQRAEILSTWNQTDQPLQVQSNLKTLFENAVEKYGQEEALCFGRKTMTYQQLNQRANQLAYFILENNVGPEQPIAVFMHRSIERVICLLAILKAGCCYVPLDPDYPKDGRLYMLKDCGAKIIFSQRDLHEAVAEYEGKIVYVDPQWDLFESFPGVNPTNSPETEQLAYMIYTSGSTLFHKGVQTTHRGVCNRLLWLQQTFKLNPSHRLLQKTPFVYDISVWEIFWPLISGATLVLARLGCHRNADLLISQVADQKITHLHFVPSVLQEFLKPDKVKICSTIQKVFCSGEALPTSLQKGFFARFPKARLHNLYGPPEVTIDATCWDFRGSATQHAFPIGRPISNVKVYALDSHFQPVPVGVDGELLVGGRGLARGYRNQPALTAARFIPDPFSEMPGSRMFKSGDVVRFMPDGNLRFIGHLEHHKKVRGFRINYSEIRAVLEEHPAISRAQVLTRKDHAGKPCLVAYLIQAGEDAPQESELCTLLRKILPNYMIPQVFMSVERFPKTPDGKMNRRALPVPVREVTKEEEPYARAHSEIERVILNAWRKVLNINLIDVNQNFFEIGGDSLGLVRVYRHLPKIMTQDLVVMDLFKHPTIHDLALFFEAREEELAISSRGKDHKDQVKRFMEKVKQDKRVTIAIVGMAGRFPGANDISTFWKNIESGKFCLSTFSSEELLDSDVDPELVEDPNYVPIRGILEGYQNFDAEFFDFTPREAQITDPQHRLFLECAWEALETAGYVPQKYKRPIGIYGGVGYSEYFASHISPNKQIMENVGILPVMIGNGTDNFCTRVAYKLGLTGPALTVQTACSTGLVAVHLACQGLKNGDSEVALAGGVHLGTLDKSGYLYEEGMTLPPDGVCRSFDARASGSTISQGAAVVVLKRLEDAINDGDCIYAVIKGSGMNNDGAIKDGYTSYSREGQEKVIVASYEQAGFSPDSISYVETSSTGSPLGDPIEVGALMDAFRKKTDRKHFCTLGALKPNIGGLDVAAGCASLIKVALSLYHRKLPPLINFEKPNPEIDWENSPFVINTRLRDWDTQGLPRRAGVSAFGLGGTNAHLSLEEGPHFDPSPQSRSWQIVTLSAKTATALDTMTSDFVQYLESHPHHNFADMCYTLHVGRHDYKYRKVLVAQNLHEAALDLKNKHSEKVFKAIHKTSSRPITFMFPGQGAQYLNMGRQLYREEQVYRREVDRCWAIVHKHFPEVYRELSPKDLVGRTNKVDRTVVTQPLLFATEYALAKLLMHWGIRPKSMIGNSLGEYVAACLSGVFSLEDCIVAIVTRGLLMQEIPSGSQLFVKLPETQVHELLNDKLSIAGIPSPGVCVVSGDKEAILQLKQGLDAQNITCYRLHASRAFHSYMMDPIIPKYTETLQKLTLNAPKIPFISNVTGTWITEAEARSPNYWANQLRDPVRFSQGLEVLFEDPNRILLEVGPEKILRTAALAHPAKTDQHRVLATMRQPQEEESDLHHLLNTVSRLWLAGVAVDWDNYHGDKKRFRMPLPTYPFEKVRHWIDKPKRDYMAILEPDVMQADIEPEDMHYRPNVNTEFVEPRDDDERFIAQAWSDFLGLKEVGIHDDFFELGGTSLVAVRLVGMLGKQFNVPLASHVLLKKRTIATLSAYIKQHAAQADVTDSPLVEIQRGHPRSLPLFLVHPVGGEVFFYRELAQALGSEQAIHAFQALSLVGKMEPFSDIRAQAANYVKELLKFRPRSPFLLGGSSYGGCVAYEMAQQLTARGYQVPLVVLVDSPGPGAVPEKLADFAEILEYLLGDELSINIDELRDRDPSEQVAYVFEEARLANRMDLLPSSLGIPMFNTWMAHQEAMHSYSPQPYNGKVIYYRPTTKAKGNLMNMHIPWIDLVKGGIEIHQVPGNHLTMNEQPNVSVLARHLKLSLRNLMGR